MKIKALFFLCFLWIPAFAQEEAIDIPIEECVEIHNGLRHILNNKLTSIFGYLHDDFQKHASDPEMIRIFGRFERVIKILELRNATYQPRNSRAVFFLIKKKKKKNKRRGKGGGRRKKKYFFFFFFFFFKKKFFFFFFKLKKTPPENF